MLALIDPYLSCHDSRFFSTVKVCIELLGQRGHAVLPARIYIHSGNPEDDRYHPESVVDRLHAWERCLRPLVDVLHPHRFKILLWGSRLGGETLHDRYITAPPGVFSMKKTAGEGSMMSSLLQAPFGSWASMRFLEVHQYPHYFCGSGSGFGKVLAYGGFANTRSS
jgi:hypothetical protein